MKDAFFGLGLKLIFIIRCHVWIASTTKWFKSMKWRMFGIKGLPRRFEVQNKRNQPIDKIHSSGKSIRPIVIGKIGFVEERKANFNYMPMFSLRNTILLWSMGTWGQMKNSIGRTKCMKNSVNVLCTIINPKDLNLGRVLSFNKSFKMFKHWKNFMLMFQ